MSVVVCLRWRVLWKAPEDSSSEIIRGWPQDSNYNADVHILWGYLLTAKSRVIPMHG